MIRGWLAMLRAWLRPDVYITAGCAACHEPLPFGLGRTEAEAWSDFEENCRRWGAAKIGDEYLCQLCRATFES